MDIPRHPAARHLACGALFLATGFAFWLNYGLVLAGFRENQISKSAPIDWRVDGIRVWGWHVKSRMEEYAKQNALFRIPFSELNMGFRKRAGMRFFPDAGRTLRLNNGHLVIPQKTVDVRDCSRQIVALRDYCAGLDVPFLYVMAPHKSDRSDPQLPRGMEDHCNDNADRFAADLSVGGVPTLDMRGRIKDSFTNYYDAFFRADNHWTPEIGLWAAAQIAQELNCQYGMDIPLGPLDASLYDFKVYPRFFLGGLGKKVTRAYIAPDDFTLITPTFDTSIRLRIPSRILDRTGTFRETLVNADSLLRPSDYYHWTPSEVYLPNDAHQLVDNLLRRDGKRILMIKDSFANSVTPFLALAVGRVDVLDLRHFSGSVYAYIEQDPPDAVVVLYSADSFALEGYNPWTQHPLPVQLSKEEE